MVLIVVLCIAGVLIAAALGTWAMHLAQQRHHNAALFFVVGFILPVIGVVIAAFTPPAADSPLYRAEQRCPNCGTTNRVTRRSTCYECRRCGQWSPLSAVKRPALQPAAQAAVAAGDSPNGGSGGGPITVGTRRDSAGDTLLEVRDLNVHFGSVHAVRGVNYRLRRGETLGIVGESGSGKSVTSLAVMGLLPQSASVSGEAWFRGTELLEGGDRELSDIRGKKIAMIFQDPMTSLDPVYKVGTQIAETLKVHNPDMSRAERRKRTIELLNIVRIPNAAERVDDYPHQFSGGMRQRVVIAIAMANNPDVIIADEPTTALDVTVQATVLEAIKAAQQETGAALILITHDLGVIAGMTDRVLVMYAGRAVETGTVDDVFYRPRMPYSVGLLNSLPRMDTDDKLRLTPIIGSLPSLQNLPPGCPFSPRCPLHTPECSEAEPVLTEVDGHDVHFAACIHSDELRGQDRYEAGQVFETTSEDTFLPAEFLAEGGEEGLHAGPEGTSMSDVVDAAEPTAASPPSDHTMHDGGKN